MAIGAAASADGDAARGTTARGTTAARRVDGDDDARFDARRATAGDGAHVARADMSSTRRGTCVGARGDKTRDDIGSACACSGGRMALYFIFLALARVIRSGVARARTPAGQDAHGTRARRHARRERSVRLERRQGGQRPRVLPRAQRESVRGAVAERAGTSCGTRGRRATRAAGAARTTRSPRSRPRRRTRWRRRWGLKPRTERVNRGTNLEKHEMDELLKRGRTDDDRDWKDEDAKEAARIKGLGAPAEMQRGGGRGRGLRGGRARRRRRRRRASRQARARGGRGDRRVAAAAAAAADGEGAEEAEGEGEEARAQGGEESGEEGEKEGEEGSEEGEEEGEGDARGDGRPPPPPPPPPPPRRDARRRVPLVR